MEDIMPNSLGGNNENNIAAKYRSISPSYLGRLDINVCGTSDPGTSAVLTPFCETDGLYFDSSHEPENFKYIFDKDIHDNIEYDGECYNISPSFNNVEDYFNYELNNMKYSKDLTFTKKLKNESDMYTIDICLDEDEI